MLYLRDEGNRIYAIASVLLLRNVLRSFFFSFVLFSSTSCSDVQPFWGEGFLSDFQKRYLKNLTFLGRIIVLEYS